MPKKKTNVKKKVIVNSPTKVFIQKKADKCCSSWIWYVLGILILLAALFFLYKGMTGNVVTGQATTTTDAFKPIVEMVSGLISNVYDVVKAPLEFIVGDTSAVGKMDSSGIFFAKVLLLLLILSITSSILLTSGIDFLKEGWTHWVVSGVVAVLSIRYLTADLINTILMPYTTFGVVISAAIPFILYFFFVEKSLGTPKSPAIRRTAWIFFAVVFLAIWVMRQGISDSSNVIIVTIYPLTAILAFVMAIMDGTVQGFFNRARISRSKEHVRGKNLVFYYDQLNECNDQWKNAVQRGNPDSYHARIISVGAATGINAYNADIKELQKRITAASK